MLATVFAVYAFGRSTAAAGRAAPGFTLPAAAGGEVTLSSMRGRVVLLDFYASWCTVCQQDAPAVETFAARYGAQVAVLGVDWREPEAATARWTAAFGLTYPNLRDGSGQVAAHYGLTGVPELWWIGRRGTARLHVVGPATFEQLQAEYAAVTGGPIDGTGIPPVPDGARVRAAAVAGGRLWIAVGAGSATPGSGGLWSRPQGGGSWEPAPLPGGGEARALAGQGDDLLAATASGPALFASQDGGRTWAAVPAPGMGRPGALAAGGGLWLAWGTGGLWSAPAPGGPWTPLPGQPPVPAGTAVTALAAGAGGRLIVATAGAAYVRAAAGGAWSAAPLRRPAMGVEEYSSAAQVITQQVALQPAAVALDAGGQAVFAAPDGVYGAAGRLARAPARAIAAVVAEPGGGLLAIAPDGDVYAGSATGPWRLLPAGAAGAGRS